MRKPNIKPLSLTAAATLALMVALPWSGPAIAQDGDPELGARVWRELSNCGDCHGWAGDGDADIAQQSGPSLRESLITPEFAFETIRCGRPGTPMPSFRRNTWSEIIPCYGMTRPLDPPMQPNNSDNPLSDRFIQALVAFIFQDFIGAGEVTREYCVSVFGEDSARCPGYPTEAESAGVPLSAH